MKLIIAGSRDWWPTNADIDAALWDQCISTSIETFPYDRLVEVVCGMAPGADMSGHRWAMTRGVPVKEMGAEWERLGKRAGKIRNLAMAEYADRAIVFWDGDSNGSTNMHAWMSVLDKPSKVYTKTTIETVRNRHNADTTGCTSASS